MLSETPLLTELALVLLAALAVFIAADELGLSPIPGWLLAGVALGPGGLGWLRDPLLHEALLEGCGALLLFIVGVELRRGRGRPGDRRALLVGALHTVVVTGGIAGVLLARGLGWRDGTFTAAALTLGCGALVLPTTLEHPVFSEGAGDLTNGILRAHVGATVLAATLPAFLAGGWLAAAGAGLALGAGLGAAGLLAAAAWWWGRRRADAPEVALLLLVALAAVVVWLALMAGLGLLAGALVAGLLVGRLARREGALGAVARPRPLLTAGFFVALGTQIDLGVLAQHAGLALTLMLAGLGATLLATMLGGVVLRSPPHAAALAGLLLAPTGTLSLALTESGNAAGLLPLGGMAGGEQVLLGAAAPLLLMAPLLLRRPRLQPAPPLPRDAVAPDAPPASAVLLVGERELSDALAARLAGGGLPLHRVVLGPRAPAPLRHALRAVEGLDPVAGAALVLATADMATAHALLSGARRRAPGLPALALAGSAHGRAFLELLGADPAVLDGPEGRERLLAALLAHVVVAGAWRAGPALALTGPDERGLERHLVAVGPGAAAAGQPIAALGLERTYGLRLVAFYQGGRPCHSPGRRQRLWAGDVLVLEGRPARLAALVAAAFHHREGKPSL